MENKPIVTVVCCSYNHEKYIRETIEGFLKQKTEYDFKILIHDDASTDNTQAIIKDVIKNYPNKFITILQSDNKRSKGIKIEKDIIGPLIKTKYVALCEGDDLWTDETKLDRAIKFLENHPGFSSFGHNTIVLDCRNGKKYKYCKYRTNHNFTLKQTIDNVPHFSSLVLKTHYFTERPDFFSHLNAGDVSLKISLCLKEKMRYCRKTMSVYRKYSGDDSFSTNNIQTNEQKILNAKRAIEYLNYVKRFVERNDVKWVDFRILKKEFEIHYLQGDYKILLSKHFKKVFRSLSLKNKIKIYLRGRDNG